jgi:hypothetical protein
VLSPGGLFLIAVDGDFFDEIGFLIFHIIDGFGNRVKLHFIF